MRPDAERLTPGVLDGAAENAFLYGACGALAIAVHDATGWPIWAVTDHHNQWEGRAGGGSALHWVVATPSGQLLDVRGLHSAEDLTAEFEDEADDGMAVCLPSSRADCVEWYVESQGEPIPLELAATFVSPVLRAAGLATTSLRAPRRPRV